MLFPKTDSNSCNKPLTAEIFLIWKIFTLKNKLKLKHWFVRATIKRKLHLWRNQVLWQSENNSIIPVIYIEPIFEYTKNTIFFNWQKIQRENQQLLILLIVGVTMISSRLLKQRWERIRRSYAGEPESCSVIMTIIVSKFVKTSWGSSQKRSRYPKSWRLISKVNWIMIQQKRRKNNFPYSWTDILMKLRRQL